MPLSFARMLLGHSGKSTGTLTASASPINEGGEVVFTLPVSGYSDGDTFPYTITGISAADITQGLTGNMTVSGENATVTINVVADNLTEGGETMTFTADDQNVGVVINDTSTTPITYSVTRNKSTITEALANPYGGGSNAANEVRFTITASSAPSDSVSYSVSGITSADLTTPSTFPHGSASGGTLNFSGGTTATLNFRAWRDYETEGVQTLTVTVGGASASVSISDNTISSTVSTTNQFTKSADYANGGTNVYWGTINTGANGNTGTLNGSSTGYPQYVVIMGMVWYDDDATSSSNIATVSSVRSNSTSGAYWTVTNDNYNDNPSPKFRTAFAHVQGSQAGYCSPRIIFNRSINHFRGVIWTCYNVHGINPDFIRYQFARGSYSNVRLTPDDTYAPQYLVDHQTGDLALGAAIASGVSNTSTYGTYGQLRNGQNSSYSSFATTVSEGYMNGSDSSDGVFKFGYWGTTGSNNAGLNWRTGSGTYPILGYANVNKYYPNYNTN